MTTTVQRWGNSKGIRIPKIILDSVCWSENEELELSLEGEKLIVQKLRNAKRLKSFSKALMANINQVKLIGVSR